MGCVMLHLETGHVVTKDMRRIEGETTIRFVTEDGRCMFEVRAGKDGRSINVRGVEVTSVDGVMYSECIDIRPCVANSVDVMVRKYDE